MGGILPILSDSNTETFLAAPTATGAGVEGFSLGFDALLSVGAGVDGAAGVSGAVTGVVAGDGAEVGAGVVFDFGADATGAGAGAGTVLLAVGAGLAGAVYDSGLP